MKKTLTLITGLKRAGKDTMGDYLISKHGYIRAQPFACFKPFIQQIFSFTDNQMTDTILKETIDPRWGISPREVMQLFGTDLMKTELGRLCPKYKQVTGNNLWAKVFYEWYLRQPCGDYVVCDWRFPEERDIFKTLEGIRTVRVNNNRILNNDTHISEHYISTMKVDYEIYNNSSLKQYYKEIDKYIKWCYTK